MGFENIRLEKGMYNVKGGITAALEQLDPSENYKGTELEGFDAYQRQLKRFDIKVSGAGSDTVEKFFATSSSSALFPEYLTRAVRAGIEFDNVLPKIVATTTHINGLDYRSVTSIPTDAEKELQTVNEGAAIPETAVHTNETLVTLHKRGRMLTASYEALRFQRLDLFTVTLKQIGNYIARQQLSDAITVLGTNAGTSNVASVGALAYSNLIDMWNALDPYQLNTIIASPSMAKQILLMSQFQNKDIADNFTVSGSVGHPLGTEFIKSSALTDAILGFDKNYALEMVIAQDVSVDTDRLIDKQLERTAITTIAGFSKLIGGAVRKIGVTAAD